QRGHHHWEAYLILSCIGIIVSSGPVYDASRLVLHAGEPGIAGEGAREPLSNHVVRPLLAGMAPGFVATAGGVAWWAHNLSVLVMLNFLPPAKHFHVITSLPNVFFRKLEPPRALSKQDLQDEVLWSCNVCRACEEACPVMIEYVDKIVDMRRHLVQEAARFPNELTRTFKGMETQSNPWGLGAEKRFDWAQGLGVPTVADKPNAEYLYYVGCAGAFDDRNKKTTQAFARLLEKAGVDFACLGKEEPCNGETARRLGNEYLYQTMAQACIESFDTAGVKKVIVNCPHCFNTI